MKYLILVAVVLMAVAAVAACGGKETVYVTVTATPTEAAAPAATESVSPSATPTVAVAPQTSTPAPEATASPIATESVTETPSPATPAATETPASPTASPATSATASTPDGTGGPRFLPGECVEVNTHSADMLVIRKEASLQAPEVRRERNGARLCIADGPLSRDDGVWWGFAEGGWATEQNLQKPGEAPLPPRFAIGQQVEVNTHSQDRMIIREQATLSAPEIRRVYNGTTLTIIDGPLERDDKVWWGFQEGGWAAGENLQAVGEEPLPATPAPTVAPPSPPQTSPYRFRLGDYALVTASPCLNLRDWPSTSAPKLTCHPPGSVVLIIGGPEYNDGYEWWEIADGDFRLGWSAGAWLVPY